MSNLHEQALQGVYQQVLRRLVNAHCEAERQAMVHLAERISRRYPQPGQGQLVLLCAGERDGLLAMALLRGAQLLLAAAQGSTFQLRVVVPMLPGLSQADHDNLQRGIGALFLVEDPRVEVLAVTHQGLLPYDGAQCRDEQNDQGPDEDGIAAQLWAWRGRQASHACLLKAAHLTWRALEGLADGAALVTAQPPALLLRHTARARRLLRLAYGPAASPEIPRASWLPQLAALYENPDRAEPPTVEMAAPLALHALLPAGHKRRWKLAMGCLGMQIDPFSLRLDPLACEDGLLAAHLAGMAARCLDDDDYGRGLAGYLRPRLECLRREGVPARLLAALRARCLSESAIHGQAYRLRRHAEQRYGLGEAQSRIWLERCIGHHGQQRLAKSSARLPVLACMCNSLLPLDRRG